MDEKDLTWVERTERDPSLAAFVSAEVARAGVDAAAWRAEAEHWRRVAAQLRRERDRLSEAEDTKGRHRQQQAGPVAVPLPAMSGRRAKARSDEPDDDLLPKRSHDDAR